MLQMRKLKAVRHVGGLFTSSSRPIANISKNRNFSNVYWVAQTLKESLKFQGSVGAGRRPLWGSLGIDDHL